MLSRSKCDETRPACSRCRRLKISCIGSGERRYKFELLTDRTFRSKTRQCGSSTSSSDEQYTSGKICYTPSNDLTVLVNAFTERVKLSKDADLRYSLTWAYGGFLVDVPRRLGINAALDAAAKALTTSHLRFITSGSEATPQELSEYSSALNLLRISLDDPAVACSANTLCAVMLLMICQVCNSSKI
jgi:Fungal Zn(2)-Cys(6) binuclear cluster domain